MQQKQTYLRLFTQQHTIMMIRRRPAATGSAIFRIRETAINNDIIVDFQSIRISITIIIN